jgi:hypothetical protein
MNAPHVYGFSELQEQLTAISDLAFILQECLTFPVILFPMLQNLHGRNTSKATGTLTDTGFLLKLLI